MDDAPSSTNLLRQGALSKQGVNFEIFFNDVPSQVLGLTGPAAGVV